MPARIEFAVPDDANAIRAISKFFQSFQHRFHFVFIPHDSDAVLHYLLQIVLDLIRIFVAGPFERRERFARSNINLVVIDLAERILFGEFRSKFSRAFSEHQKIGERIAAEAIRPINPGRTFPRGKQTRQARHLRVRIDPHATHDVMRCWSDFHRLLRDIDVCQLFKLVVHTR